LDRRERAAEVWRRGRWRRKRGAENFSLAQRIAFVLRSGCYSFVRSPWGTPPGGPPQSRAAGRHFTVEV
jgi:hypothetical protein